MFFHFSTVKCHWNDLLPFPLFSFVVMQICIFIRVFTYSCQQTGSAQCCRKKHQKYFPRPNLIVSQCLCYLPSYQPRGLPCSKVSLLGSERKYRGKSDVEMLSGLCVGCCCNDENYLRIFPVFPPDSEGENSCAQHGLGSLIIYRTCQT